MRLTTSEITGILTSADYSSRIFLNGLTITIFKKKNLLLSIYPDKIYKPVVCSMFSPLYKRVFFNFNTSNHIGKLHQGICVSNQKIEHKNIPKCKHAHKKKNSLYKKKLLYDHTLNSK